MDNSAEILVTPIEQAKPFEHTPAQNFLTKWCAANDALVPNFVVSDNWVEGTPLAQQEQDGTITLNIPDDIRLWELVPYIQTIDADTYRNNPQRAANLEEGHKQRARLFTNTAIYIAQRLPDIAQGQAIAQAMAQEFYIYGKRLEHAAGYGSTSQDELHAVTIEHIADQPLSVEATTEVDEWIAGNEVYESRLKRAEANAKKNYHLVPIAVENERTRALNQIFKLAEHAVNRQGDPTVTQKVLAEKPYYSLFLQKVKDRIKKGVEDPLHDLMVSIYDRGLEDLKTEFIRTPDHASTGKQISEYISRFMNRKDSTGQSLQDALKVFNIPGWRVHLQQLRESGNTQLLVQEEMRAALSMQQIISTKMEYNVLKQTPTDILETGETNCVGSALVSDVMLRSLGIPNAPVHIPGHLTTAIQTADGNVHLIDMGNGRRFNHQLHDDDFVDGSVDDIRKFIDHPNEGSLALHSSPQLLPLFTDLMGNQVGDSKSVVFMRPTEGVMYTIMSNMAADHEIRGEYDDAIGIYQYLATHVHQRPETRFRLASMYLDNGQIDKATEEVRNWSARHNDGVKPPHYLQAQILESNGDHEAALAEYRQAYEDDTLSYYVLSSLCDSLVRTGETEEGLRMMKRLTALHIFTEARDMLNVAKSSRHSVDLAKSMWSFMEAIKTDPSLYHAHYGIARAAHHLGDKETEEKAINAFREQADPEKDAEFIYLIEHPELQQKLMFDM